MEIAVWVSHRGTTSFTISFRFTHADDGAPLAEGYMRAVCVDRQDKRPVDIPGRLREALEPYTGELRIRN